MTYTPLTYGDAKNSVRVASTANLSISSPGATIDGVTMAVGNRVLLKDQTSGAENGIWIWQGAAVALTRALDADGAGELTSGVHVFVEEGTTNAGFLYVLTTANPITVGSTPISFTQFSSGASTLDGLTDVDTTGVTAGNLLYYDGANWADTPTATLGPASSALSLSGTTPGIWMEDQPATASAGAFLVTDTTLFQVQKRASAFGAFVDTPLSIQLASGSEALILGTGATYDVKSASSWSSTSAVFTTETGIATALRTTQGAFLNTRAAATNQALVTGQTAEARARFELLANGQMAWGDGTAARDVVLSRSAADTLALASGDKIQQNAAPTVGDDLTNKTYVDTKAPLASPALTGTPSAPTAADDTATTQIATTNFVQTAKAQAKLWAFTMA